jgi:hypothetical protein
MKKNKRTFEDFLKIIYGMSMVDYDRLPRLTQKAIEVDYIDRYGKPIVWW